MMTFRSDAWDSFADVRDASGLSRESSFPCGCRAVQCASMLTRRGRHLARRRRSRLSGRHGARAGSPGRCCRLDDHQDPGRCCRPDRPHARSRAVGSRLRAPALRCSRRCAGRTAAVRPRRRLDTPARGGSAGVAAMAGSAGFLGAAARRSSPRRSTPARRRPATRSWTRCSRRSPRSWPTTPRCSAQPGRRRCRRSRSRTGRRSSAPSSAHDPPAARRSGCPHRHGQPVARPSMIAVWLDRVSRPAPREARRRCPPHPGAARPPGSL